jgi:hypothetical protein
MFQKLKTLLLAVFVVSVLCHAYALDHFPVTDADKKFLSEVVLAVNQKDTSWIANHMAYPLSFVSSNQTRLVKTEKEFAAVLKQNLTDNIRAKIVNDAKKPLFKNWQGVMAGDGVVWFSGIRRAMEQANTGFSRLVISHLSRLRKSSEHQRSLLLSLRFLLLSRA